jgi:hypothetical protein
MGLLQTWFWMIDGSNKSTGRGIGFPAVGQSGDNAMRINPYQQGLDKNAANFVALSPISFIQRTARVYPIHRS